MDLAPHTVTTAASPADARASIPNDPFGEDADPDTFSVFLPQGASYEHRFSEPGEYAYFCFFHASQGMVGTVTVVG